VETPLVELSDEAFDGLLGNVDVLEVRIDADNAGTYRSVHGADAFERVLANIERIQAARRARRIAQPVVACSLTRCAATLPEVEPFFDRWIRATGWAVIRGFSEYCGVLPADSLLGTTPAVRGPCRRLWRRMMLLADGRAVLCAQDVAGAVMLGSWLETSLSDLWRGAVLEAAREAHSAASLGDYPLCARCREWHRP